MKMIIHVHSNSRPVINVGAHDPFETFLIHVFGVLADLALAHDHLSRALVSQCPIPVWFHRTYIRTQKTFIKGAHFFPDVVLDVAAPPGVERKIGLSPALVFEHPVLDAPRMVKGRLFVVQKDIVRG